MKRPSMEKNNSLKQENRRLQAEVDRLSHELEISRAQLDALRQSLTWRLADNLRKQLERIPIGRHLLRRIIQHMRPTVASHTNSSGWIDQHHAEDANVNPAGLNRPGTLMAARLSRLLFRSTMLRRNCLNAA